MGSRVFRWRRLLVCAVALAGLVGAAMATAAPATADHSAELVEWVDAGLVPAPASLQRRAGESFVVTGNTRVVATDDAQSGAVGERFAAWLRAGTGFDVEVATSGGPDDITLALDGDLALGPEGYTLRSGVDGVAISATTAEGLFRGVTTLRQLLPASLESVAAARAAPMTVPGLDIADVPRFGYRGVMIDVARHFFGVDDVLRVIDYLALHKLNVLHLHLTDDQGWRFPVATWPALTEVGGASDIEGGPGGSFTAEEFALIVEYAAERYVEIVPEIDLPGHTTAALVAAPELTCDGVAPPPYTQPGIAPVKLCVGSDAVRSFVGDVLDSVVAQSPGPLVHVGGDETLDLEPDDLHAFVAETTNMVVERGRTPMVWHDAVRGPLPPGTVVQYWGFGDAESSALAFEAAAAGSPIVMSPPSRAYYDMSYDASSPYGLAWAGFVPLSASYDWDPAQVIEGLPPAAILGVEAALWSETIPDRAALEWMLFPRLASIADIGWSPAVARDWESFRVRVAAQGPRWDTLGVNYYRSPEVAWPTDGGSADG